MRPIVYDVAISVDGFICRRDGSIEDFTPDGPHVDDYQARLEAYETVVMGRRTYEFGYRYGLAPGARAYPHMDHFVFSSSLEFDHAHEINIVADRAADVVRDLKRQDGAAIYLCGGGGFAGFLLQHGLIDRLVLKVNPVIIGDGVPLFECAVRANLRCTGARRYDNGVVLVEYDVLNAAR